MSGARRLMVWCVFSTTAMLAITGAALAEEDEDDGDRLADDPLGAFDFGFDGDLVMPSMAVESLGATPGGAQDIGWYRDQVARGAVPHPNTITPEGLFSEHDLPVPASQCRELLCVTGQAIPARLLVQQDVRMLAQLGFASGLTEETFEHRPLNLVAVVDTSGSMAGAPLDTVRESLRQVASQLGRGDQLAIVRYSDEVEQVLTPTAATDRRRVERAIGSLVSSGSTYLEAGLKLGFEVAQKSAARFRGTTRVMLFTDERPNVGRTDAGSFMQMAEQASRQGVGLTTIGVATHFGAELATKVSSVRGGNLFFFPDVAEMRRVFEEELDTMVTELAYDLKLAIRPGKGLKIVGVYGIPGDALEWGDDGAIRLEVATIFLSRRKGAIFIALAPKGRIGLPSTRYQTGEVAARVGLSYEEVTGVRKRESVDLTLVGGDRAGVGLRRGRMLVDQVTSLKEAGIAHHERNDQERAYKIIRDLASLYRGSIDPELAEERQLVFTLEQTLAEMSGHHGEPQLSHALHPVTGLPPR
ncbi:MAG: VWA domain-containing protein [Deltaproteobacteria bacterium]|nr:VWA domain-containing protein [Deltaproteobacteria bacterium]